jgi:Spy/CpxP family protein refolding chaperone
MKNRALIMAIIVVALMVSSSAFGQMSQKMQAGAETEQGMHKMCSQMGGMMPEMMMKCCAEMMKGTCEGMCKGEEKMSCCKQEFFLCCKEQLELTDEQVASLKSIKMDFMKGEIQGDADMKLAELELKELMSADKLDMAKVEKQIRNIHGMEAEKKIAHLKAFEKAKTVLTPEQLEKQKEHHKMMMKGM